MAIMNLDDILIPAERIRREFPEKQHQELVESILDKGLMHPIVVDKEGFLLAGERRYRALKSIAEMGKDHFCGTTKLRPGLALVTVFGELHPMKRLEAELEENTKRLQLDWKDEARAVEALHRLRTIQAEYNLQVNGPHTVAKTAAEIKNIPVENVNWKQKENVKDHLLISAWLNQGDPDVEKAKDRREALKIIERKLVEEHRKALAQEFDRDKINTPHNPIWGDMREILPTLTDKFDVILCDPPYGIDADASGNQAAVPHDYKDNLEHAVLIWTSLARDGYAICKQEAHAYIFCDIRRFQSLSEIFRSAGWKVWPTPLIWYKGETVGIAPRPEHGPRRTYEAILFASKGDRPIILPIRSDVLFVPHERGVERAAHKPVELYKNLLRRSVEPGNRVIDPCCGSGPIFSAADDLKVVATGIEIDQAAFGLTLQRIKGDFSRSAERPVDEAAD